jgi:hypothetical protein
MVVRDERRSGHQVAGGRSQGARVSADMAQPSGQTISAMVGADLGHLCAATVMGTVNTGGSRPSPGTR